MSAPMSRRRPAKRTTVAPKRRRAEDLRGQRGTRRFVILTGLSGAGKTQAIRALEDLGYFCVDNLPSALIPTMAELASRADTGLEKVAIVADVREGGFLRQFPRVFKRLKAMRGIDPRLIFLEASSSALVRRFSETRRPHPLAINQPAIEGIREEREALRPIREIADTHLDTSDYTVHELRDWVKQHYSLREEGSPMVLSVMSFGYKYGVPPEADLVFDARFLPNPNFVPALKAQTGSDAAVIRYMNRQKDTGRFLRKLDDFLSFVVPQYVKEGKSYLTIAIGCTGGRHRSVMIANALARTLRSRNCVVRVRHRDSKQVVA